MRSKIKERYNLVDIHDSQIISIVIKPTVCECTLELRGAAVLKESDRPFDYEILYEPAQLNFHGVRDINFPERYCLNSLIVTDEVLVIENTDYFRFILSMTGGWDNDTYWRTIEIVAKDFSLTGTGVPYGPNGSE